MVTNRQRAWDIALDHYGYVTTAEAKAAGIPGIELVKLAGRGKLQHVAHGVYRFEEFPVGRFGQYYEAVMRVGGDAFLVGDAVLSLYDLASVNPHRIRVGTAKRCRREIPSWIQVQPTRVELQDRAILEGVPSTTLKRAFLDASGYVIRDRLLLATVDAVQRGLLDEMEARLLQRELRGSEN
jgi:predicted transcriptional regulator of viral defense system